jgi:hypothetical protein
VDKAAVGLATEAAQALIMLRAVWISSIIVLLIARMQLDPGHENRDDF